MARKLRPTTLKDLHDIDQAIRELKLTRDLLRSIGAKKAVEAVSRAIKSTEGAARHGRRSYDASKQEREVARYE